MVEKRKEYRIIASRLIRTLPEFDYIKNSGVRIAYLGSDEEKKKDRRLVFADCYKVNKSRYEFCCPYDFFITVYEPNTLDFTEEQMEILIRHELHHVGIDTEGNDNSYYIVPHDVEEFWSIIDEHGLRWSE